MPPRKTKLPTQLFLLSNTQNRVDSAEVATGTKNQSFGYAADEIVYYRLTPKCADYLQMTRLWPVALRPTTTLTQDETWGRWNFNIAEVGEPIDLDKAAAWQVLLDAGLKKKPRTKHHESALSWPALQGYVEPLRLLLDSGVVAGHDDPLTAAAAFGKAATAKLLAERGFDVGRSLAVMEKYKNEVALKILRDLA